MQARILLVAAVLGISVLSAGCKPKGGAADDGTAEDIPTDAGRDAAQAMEHFGEKPYVVCDLGNRAVHEGFKGEHLKLSEQVRIFRDGAVLKVAMGEHTVDMVPSDESTRLEGQSSFKHDQVVATAAPEAVPSPTMIEHRVSITKSIGYRLPDEGLPHCIPPETDETAGEIIDIEFCPPDGSGGWKCNPDNFHQGDVHAQN